MNSTTLQALQQSLEQQICDTLVQPPRPTDKPSLIHRPDRPALNEPPRRIPNQPTTGP